MDPSTFLLMTPTSGGGSIVRLAVSGPYFVRPDGTIHRRKGITAFCAPKRFATGRGDEVRRFFDWTVAHGGNEARKFSRVDWAGPPGAGVEPGWEYNEQASETSIREAAARGLWVQMVALPGPYGGVQQSADHLRRVDDLCCAYDNAILEVWNEPQQNGGHDFVQEVLDCYTPRCPGWSIGAYQPTPYPRIVQTGVDDQGRPIYARDGGSSGPSMDYHSPRKSEWSRCAKDAYEFSIGSGPNNQFSPAYAGAIMLSEPPQVEQIIRDAGQGDYWPDQVEDWRAYGAGCAFWGCGGTIHGNPDFQQCVIPSDPRVTACVQAFYAGFDDVPLQRYHGYDRGDPPSSNPGSRRYFRWGEDGRQYELCVRPYSFGAV